MKKILFLLCLIGGAVLNVSAQWTTSGTNAYFNLTGNVGVGTSSPAYKFDVNGDIRASSILYGNGMSLASGLVQVGNTNASYITGNTRIGSDGSLNLGGTLTVSMAGYTGNIGIGTPAPTHSLTFASTATGIALYKTADQTTNYERLIAQLQGNVFTIGSYFGGSGTQPRPIQIGIQAGPGTTTLSSGRVFTINPVTGTTAGVFDFFNTTAVAGSVVTVNTNMLGASVQQNMLAIEGTVNQTGSSGYRGLFVSPYIQGTGSGSKLLIDAGTNSAASGSGTHTSKFMVDDSGNGYFAGNVGIGTSTAHTEALSVNGTIRSKEVVVETTGWPDYVFAPSYALPGLKDVKTYIDKNHHLPGLPSAAEIEATGLKLGEINKILTKKIEELTLYLIDADKKLSEQAQKNDSQEQLIKALETKLDLLLQQAKK